MVESITGKAKSGIWGLDNILAGGFTREHLFLIEGAPGTGKTTIALQFLMEGARVGENPPTSPFPKPSRSYGLARPLTAGRLMSGSKCSSCFLRRACSIPSSSRACCILPTSSWAKPPSRFSRPSIARSRTGWCWTAFPRSGCWRKARCGTGGRFWRSSTISQISAPRFCCSMTCRLTSATNPSTAWRTACCGWRS